MGDLTGSLESSIREIRRGEAALKRYSNDQLALQAIRPGLVGNYHTRAITLGNPIQLNLGEPDTALPYARKALELAREVAASNSNADLLWLNWLNSCYLNLAALLRD